MFLKLSSFTTYSESITSKSELLTFFLKEIILKNENVLGQKGRSARISMDLSGKLIYSAFDLVDLWHGKWPDFPFPVLILLTHNTGEFIFPFHFQLIKRGRTEFPKISVNIYLEYSPRWIMRPRIWSKKRDNYYRYFFFIIRTEMKDSNYKTKK